MVDCLFQQTCDAMYCLFPVYDGQWVAILTLQVVSLRQMFNKASVSKDVAIDNVAQQSADGSGSLLPSLQLAKAPE